MLLTDTRDFNFYMARFLTFITALCIFAALTGKAPATASMHGQETDFVAVPDSNSAFYFNEADYKDSLEHYRTLFGKNVEVADSLELAFLVALSHYPELYNAHIEVESKTMFTTMQARPSNASVFKKATNRIYKVYINDRKGKNKGIHLSCLNFNSRVGFFGHELAHLLSYQHRSGLDLIGMGLKYSFSKSYKRQVERETDMETIRHGLGYALYESKVCILHGDHDVPEDYKANAQENYMSDNEILESIRKLNIYSTANINVQNF